MWYFTSKALHDFPLKFDKAAYRAFTTEEWENFYDELLPLMIDYDAFYNSTDFILRGNIVIRLELALLALQQVITLATERRLDCVSVLQEIFNNVRILLFKLELQRVFYIKIIKGASVELFNQCRKK